MTTITHPETPTKESDLQFDRVKTFLRAFPVYQVSLQKLFASKRRNIMIGLVLLFPILGNSIGIILGDSFYGRTTFLRYYTFFTYFYYNALVGVVILLFFAVTLTSEEFSNKTIVYFLHSPIRRTDIILWKYLAYVSFTIILFLPINILFYCVFAWFVEPDFLFEYLDLLQAGIILTLFSIFLYGSLFFFIALAVPRYPLIFGLIIALADLFLQGSFFEGLLGAYSISYHVRAVAADTLGYRSILSNFNPVMSVPDSYLVIIFYIFLYGLLAIWKFNRREVV
ncbi:MAG: ABC transporter permease [Candidatus Hodarchaeales archaeon]|jgi:ABC-type transport system involved in multi-copper enzyme maturation permease subunit